MYFLSMLIQALQLVKPLTKVLVSKVQVFLMKSASKEAQTLEAET